MGLNEEMTDFITELYLKYNEKLCIVAGKRLGDETVAQDIVDETFEIAILKVDSLYTHPNKLAWLYKVLDFTIRKYFAANTYRKTSLDNQGKRITEYKYIQSVPIEDFINKLSIEEDFYDGNVFDNYQSILSEKEIKYLIYKFEYGLDTAEISRLLGTTNTGTTSLAWRIRNKIKNFLE